MNYQDPTAKLLEPLLQEYNTLGMTTSQMQLYKLAMAGVDQADQQFAARLLAKVDAQKASHQASLQMDADADRYRNSLMEFALGVYSDVETPAGKAADKMERLNEAFRAGYIDQQTYRKAVDATQKALDDEKLDVEATTWSMERAGISADKVGAELEQAFSQSIIYGRDLGSVFITLIEKFAEMIVQATLFKSIAGSLSGKSGVAGFLGDVFGKMAGFVGGGDVSGGVPILVGEGGPELFVPGSSGSIIPNGALSAAVNNRGGDVILNIDARGADGGVEYRIQRGIQTAMRQATIGGALLSREMSRRR